MNRQLLSVVELEQWLTAELRKVEDCEECLVGGIMRLQETDADGCNWSDSVAVRSAGVPQQYFGPYLSRIIAAARRRFNVK